MLALGCAAGVAPGVTAPGTAVAAAPREAVPPKAVPPGAPATPAAGAAEAPPDDGDRPGDGIALTPKAGAAGVTVGIRADCETAGDGTVASPAFASVVKLRPAGDAAVARATVKPGLRPGRRYVVTANCSAGESLTSSFVHPGQHTEGRPGEAGAPGDRPGRRADVAPEADGGGRTDGSSGHAPPQSRHEAAAPRGSSAGNVALAFSGGLATAALAGYLLTARARRAVRR